MSPSRHPSELDAPCSGRASPRAAWPKLIKRLRHFAGSDVRK